MMCRLRMGCENRNGEMSANKWVTNNKAINQQGWRLQKGITMRSLLLLFCCCCCVCAFTICHSTIYNNYSLECLSSFVAAVCGHCFHANSFPIAVLCVCPHHTNDTHTLHSFSVSQSCFYQYEIGFGDPGFFNVWPCLHISTHMTIVQVNLIRCTHRTDEYVK